MLDELLGKFGNCEYATFSEHPKGFERVTLRSKRGHEADIYLYGATVTSWRIAPGDDLLFLSSKVEFKKGKAIRGGIPIVFPQFGPGPINLGSLSSSNRPEASLLPSHGFARIMDWQVQSLREFDSDSVGDGAVELKLGLNLENPLGDLWTYPVRLTYTVTLGETLRTTLAVTNKSSVDITFQEALHTYLRISDISTVQIPGFSGLTYLDNLKGRAPAVESRDVILVAEEIDRAYVSAPSRVEIFDGAKNRTIGITSQSFKDAVVWNPWVEKSKSLSDLGSEDYKHFICVEFGNIAAPIVLSSGSTHQASQEFDFR